MTTEPDDGNAAADSDSTDGDSIPQRFLERTVDDVIEGREPYDNEETLRTLHHIRGHSQEKIANAYGVDQSTISRAMDDHGVPTRESDNSPTVEESEDEDTASATAN